jgi:heat-inducible transcriptional repressor
MSLDTGPDGITPTPLEERKASILRAIVEEYVATAQPVGSGTIVQTRALGVSAATVRNDMGALERDGYVVQPHTSAGRIPTDKGYRYFVDHHLEAASALPTLQRKAVADFFASSARVIDDLLHDTSQLLARVTSHAAVVVGPQASVTHVRALHVVALDERVLLAVAVLSNGVVEREMLRFDGDVAPGDVDSANRILQDLVGGDVDELAPPVAANPADAQSVAHVIAVRAVEALRSHTAEATEPLFVGGAAHLAADGEAFTSPVLVARLLELLEQQTVMVAVVRELLGPGLTITIGRENRADDLKECSLVLAPYLVEGTPAGTIGVLGPTRMDYRQAQAAVSTISALLSRQLSQ